MISILQAAKLFLGLRDVQVLRQIAQVIRDLFQLLDCAAPVIGVWQDLAHIKQARTHAASIASEGQELLLLLLEATVSSGGIRATYSFGGARGKPTLLRSAITSICGDELLFLGTTNISTIKRGVQSTRGGKLEWKLTMRCVAAILRDAPAWVSQILDDF